MFLLNIDDLLHLLVCKYYTFKLHTAWNDDVLSGLTLNHVAFLIQSRVMITDRIYCNLHHLFFSIIVLCSLFVEDVSYFCLLGIFSSWTFYSSVVFSLFFQIAKKLSLVVLLKKFATSESVF